ncbi:hypothetical protein [Mangrovihabitans endophyticus]|uniref:Lipoprotein n=1 Tax=Mangrovihabitans endophyticus TaxID=1751298 RepID=A0A8J3C3D7_9ACTN|nr:hypothetical protein [Mangrovihabitans endophyticus]GGL12917.1 hypothetical protein GCM10012284_54470 [Mangrovihabitans endophyticus]
MTVPYRAVASMLAAITVTALVLTAPTGCTAKDEAVQPTDTQPQATARVDQLTRQAVAALPDGTTLKYHDGSDEAPCDDPTDNGPAGRIFVEHRYTLVPPDDDTWSVDDVIPALVAYWHDQSYRVHDDRRTDPDPRYVVETPDGYALTLDALDRGDRHDFTLTGSSPCIWPNGSPDAQ